MIKTEFGIINDLDTNKNCSDYTPQKYNCIVIDDDLYINRWWPDLILLPTFFHSLSQPNFGLARWGTTLIPPSSLAAFQEIVLNDPTIQTDKTLSDLAELIQLALKSNKYLIHFGV